MRGIFKMATSMAAALGFVATQSARAQHMVDAFPVMKRGPTFAMHGGRGSYRAGMKAKAIHTAKRRRIKAGKHF